MFGRVGSNSPGLPEPDYPVDPGRPAAPGRTATDRGVGNGSSWWDWRNCAPATAVRCTHLCDVSAVLAAVASIPRSAQVQTPALATKSDVSTRHTTTVDGVVAGRPTTVRRASQRWGATGGAPRTSPPSPVPLICFRPLPLGCVPSVDLLRQSASGARQSNVTHAAAGRRSLQARIRKMADLVPLHSI